MSWKKACWPFVAALTVLAGAAISPHDPVGASDREPTIATARPTRWMPGNGACRKVRGKGKVCDGPRRVPEPYGAAAAQADELGLGGTEAAQHLLTSVPRQSWVDAVRGEQRPTLLWPVESGSFGRGFGYTRTGKSKSLRHDGVDVGARVGELVRSMNDGIVAYSDNQVSGYGNMVMVVHKDRSVSLYAHHRANYVFAGQQVRRGQVIGEVGLTGITRGPHLHFQWHARGRPKDPMPRMVGQPRRRGPLTDLTLL